ncbi:Tyrosine-protein kinase Wzc [hydrothermal vent metagenome]|uniref:non-specific protein-tyrosine kinase n=1 Tax=hydrothermal vent metagenome TaxID=652676 RepID=A0A1W1EB30_9ZZZZ
MIGLILGGISASPYVKDGTSIIVVYFNDTVPLRAKEILDAISQSYIADNLEIKSRSAKKRLAFIDMQLKAINKTLQGSSQKLQQYKATNVFVSLNEKAKNVSNRLSVLEAKAYALNTQISILESLLNYVQTHKSLRGINIDSSVQISRQISGIIDAIQKSIVQYDTLLVTHTKHHPQVVKVKKQLESLKRSLVDTVRANLKTLKEEKRSLEHQIETYKKELKDLPVQEQKLEALNRNFMVNEKIYSMLLEERATTAIVEASNISYVRILEAPYIPSDPIKPKRKLIILVGFIVGFILGMAQAFVREFFDTTFKSLEELEDYTDVPVYGIVPHRSNKRSLIHYKEAMYVIWSNLELSPNATSVKVITVTSSVSGEGKTLTTAEFGKVIAKNGKKVIIVNLDMRKPTLHEAFDLPNTIGMSTLLSGKDSLASVIQKTSIDTLDVITSGPKPPNPTGLIMSENLSKAIEVLKTRYDYVLIDSPPIGLVADAKKIMYLSDLTLIIIRVNFSQKNFIKVVNRFYEEEKINLDIILNDMPSKKSYGYGYGYEYGV